MSHVKSVSLGLLCVSSMSMGRYTGIFDDSETAFPFDR